MPVPAESFCGREWMFCRARPEIRSGRRRIGRAARSQSQALRLLGLRLTECDHPRPWGSSALCVEAVSEPGWMRRDPGMVPLRLRRFDRSASTKLSPPSTNNHAKCGRTAHGVTVIRGAVECGHPLRSGHLYLFLAPLANAVTPSRKVTVT